jgi:hypothetical protein
MACIDEILGAWVAVEDRKSPDAKTGLDLPHHPHFL